MKGTRFAGRQFVTTFPKKGSVADVYFTKEFQVIGGDYASTQPQRYLKTQPRDLRKKGFLSGDASKRDEVGRPSQTKTLNCVTCVGLRAATTTLLCLHVKCWQVACRLCASAVELRWHTRF